MTCFSTPNEDQHSPFSHADVYHVHEPSCSTLMLHTTDFWRGAGSWAYVTVRVVHSLLLTLRLSMRVSIDAARDTPAKPTRSTRLQQLDYLISPVGFQYHRGTGPAPPTPLSAAYNKSLSILALVSLCLSFPITHSNEAASASAGHIRCPTPRREGLY